MAINIADVLVNCDHKGFNIIKNALSLIFVLHSKICCRKSCLIVCIIGDLSASKKSFDFVDETLSLVLILASVL